MSQQKEATEIQLTVSSENELEQKSQFFTPNNNEREPKNVSNNDGIDSKEDEQASQIASTFEQRVQNVINTSENAQFVGLILESVDNFERIKLRSKSA